MHRGAGSIDRSERRLRMGRSRSRWTRGLITRARANVGKVRGSEGPNRYFADDQLKGWGFDSPHLHDVFETFPQVTGGVTCGDGLGLTRF